MISIRSVARFAVPLAVVAGLGFSHNPVTVDGIDLLSPSPAFARTATQYTDGEYTAEGKGIGGKVPVTVTIKDGKITDVTVGDNSETQGIGSKAIEQLPALIVEANGTDGVDVVSGASVTSKAILNAVDDCLEQATDENGRAATSDGTEASDTSGATTCRDGEYTAWGKGIGGKVPVTVVIEDGRIASVEVGENSETQGIGSKAIEKLPDEIVEAGGTKGVDGVSGASVTSKAILTAVDDCLEQAGYTDKSDEPKDKNADSSDSLIVSADDHLGTTYFGKMALTIPDTYTCLKFEQDSTSDGAQSVEAAYTRRCSARGAILIKVMFLEGVADAYLDDPCQIIEALTVADLQATGDDGLCVTASDATRLSDGSYFGVYTIELDGADCIVIGGGAVDEDGNLLLIRVWLIPNVSRTI